MKRTLLLLSGPCAGLMLYFLSAGAGLSHSACSMAFLTGWMAAWWISEAVEIGVTSLLPFIIMPLMQVMKAEEVAVHYMDQVIFLFIGGFFLAYAMEKWSLHERLAYRILLLSGTSPARVLAGIMITAYLISMWISNTATTLMLVAAVAAIAGHKQLFKSNHTDRNGAAFLIALAYSATIGGMATLVGTPTNMIFSGYWESHYPRREAVSFLQWSAVGLPLSLVMLGVGYVVLRKMFGISNTQSDTGYIREQYKALGSPTREQLTVSGVFGLTVLLWFTRAGIDFGGFRLPGWEEMFSKGYLKDSTVAIAASALLFLLPARKGRLLEWRDVTKLPFHIILLFGGGFALADGIEVSGLGDFLASQLQVFRDYPLWVLVALLALVITLLSELASNVATITLMLPILGSLAEAIGVDPLKLMMPATFAASFGFMLVVATAPNTIAYATGYFKSRDLMKAGLCMNLVGIVLLLLFMSFF